MEIKKLKNQTTLKKIDVQGEEILRIPDFIEKIETNNLVFNGIINGEHIKTLIIPSSVKCIGEGAFANLKELTEIIFEGESNLYTIGPKAFYGCSSLIELVLPDSVVHLHPSCFYGCTNLKSVCSGEKLEFIDEAAFRDCSNLEKVDLRNSKCLTAIKDKAFAVCGSLYIILLPQGIKEIGWNVFYKTGYYNNKNNWTGDVLYIGEYLLSKKNNNKEYIEVRYGTKLIAKRAFSRSKVKTVNLGKVEYINDDAFFQSYLERITIPDTVKIIGRGAFIYSDLKHIEFQGNEHYISPVAFGFLHNLTSITLKKPDVEYLDYESIFHGIKSVKTMRLTEDMKLEEIPKKFARLISALNPENLYIESDYYPNDFNILPLIFYN